MTDLHRRYLRSAIGVACGSLIAVILIAVVEQAGEAFISGNRMARKFEPKSDLNQPAARPKSPIAMPLHDSAREIPDIRFEDGNGRSLALSDFRSKVVLLNVWATWCVPCRKEMPTLDRLQAKLGGPDFEVVALSIDRAGAEVVRKFYGGIGITRLAMYIDKSGKATRELGIAGIPATLLIDREGREIGRLVGPAEWDAPAMVESIRRHVARKGTSLDTATRRHAAVSSIATDSHSRSGAPL